MTATLFRKLKRLDWFLFAVILGLSIAGVFFINSATFTSDRELYREAYRSQMYWIPIAVMAFFFFALIDYEIWPRISPYLFAGVAVLLIIVIFTPKRYGASSWIRFGSLGVQPTELTKLIFIMLFTYFFMEHEDRIKELLTVVKAVGLVMVPVVLVMLQPDFGSAAVFLPMAFVMMWVAGIRKRYLAVPVVAVILLVGYTYFGVHKNDLPIPFLKPYQVERIKTFYDPNRDLRGHGWSVSQTMIAIGSGGLTGKGWKNGTQHALGYVPQTVSYNDFIFSVIGEEQGFVGGALIVILQGFVLLSCLRIASLSRDAAGALLAAGATAMLFTHAFVNIGMTIKVVPVTGIPLPFISHGGSFLVICMATIGLLQSVWIHRKSY